MTNFQAKMLTLSCKFLIIKTKRAKTVQHILLIRDMVVECCNRRFGSETIHPTQKFTLMNLLQMSCMITWAQKTLSHQPKKKRGAVFSKKKFKLGFRPGNFSVGKKSFHANLKNVN